PASPTNVGRAGFERSSTARREAQIFIPPEAHPAETYGMWSQSRQPDQCRACGVRTQFDCQARSANLYSAGGASRRDLWDVESIPPARPMSGLRGSNAVRLPGAKRHFKTPEAENADLRNMGPIPPAA